MAVRAATRLGSPLQGPNLPVLVPARDSHGALFCAGNWVSDGLPFSLVDSGERTNDCDTHCRGDDDSPLLLRRCSVVGLSRERHLEADAIGIEKFIQGSLR